MLNYSCSMGDPPLSFLFRGFSIENRKDSGLREGQFDAEDLYKSALDNEQPRKENNGKKQ